MDKVYGINQERLMLPDEFEGNYLVVFEKRQYLDGFVKNLGHIYIVSESNPKVNEESVWGSFVGCYDIL
jgi:hypothetical protein